MVVDFLRHKNKFRSCGNTVWYWHWEWNMRHNNDRQLLRSR
jgi:hypothetical protein